MIKYVKIVKGLQADTDGFEESIDRAIVELGENAVIEDIKITMCNNLIVATILYG